MSVTTQSPTGFSNPPPAPTAQTDVSVATTMSYKDIVLSVTDKLDSSALLTARLGDPPASETRSGVWLYATIVGAAKDYRANYGRWQAFLAQGAVSARLTAAYPAQKLIGSSVDLQVPDGSMVPNIDGSIASNSAPFTKFSDATDSEINDAVTALLPKFGLRLKTLDVFRPLDAAVKITAVVEDESKLDYQVGPLLYALNQPVPYEGVFLEIDSPTGEPLSIQLNAKRAGEGLNWFKPGQDKYGSPHG